MTPHKMTDVTTTVANFHEILVTRVDPDRYQRRNQYVKRLTAVADPLMCFRVHKSTGAAS